MAHPSWKQLAPVIHQRRVESAKNFAGKRIFGDLESGTVAAFQIKGCPEFLQASLLRKLQNHRTSKIFRHWLSIVNRTKSQALSKFTNFRPRLNRTCERPRASARKQLRWDQFTAAGQRCCTAVLHSKSLDSLVHKITSEGTWRGACNIKCSSCCRYDRSVHERGPDGRKAGAKESS